MTSQLPALLSLCFLMLAHVSCTSTIHDDPNVSSPYSSSRSLQNRIVGGSNAPPTRFPYYTYLVFETDHNDFRCGGTLIQPDIVMSAAHCYEGLIQSGYEVVRINAWVNLTSIYTSNTGFEHKRKVVQVLMHPQYNPMTNANDVILFKLNREVPNVPLPRLPRVGRVPPTGASLQVIGLGKVSESGNLASILQVVTVSVISYENCNDQDSYRGDVDSSSMICAGTPQGGKDACYGDSGGPLLRQKNLPKKDVIIGITSWGVGCARAQKYGVYAKVSSLVGFVRDGICTLSSSSSSKSAAFCSPPKTRTRPLDKDKNTTTTTTSTTTSRVVPLKTTLSTAGIEVAGITRDDKCTGWGELCTTSDECCSHQCVETRNQHETRCFGGVNS